LAVCELLIVVNGQLKHIRKHSTWRHRLRHSSAQIWLSRQTDLMVSWQRG